MEPQHARALLFQPFEVGGVVQDPIFRRVQQLVLFAIICMSSAGSVTNNAWMLVWSRSSNAFGAWCVLGNITPL